MQMTTGSLFRLGAAAIALSLATVTDSPAKVRVSCMFGANMVLQRDMPVPVWGWADKGERVTVSFWGQEKSTTTGGDGKWMVKLDPFPTSKTPAEMVVSGSNKVTFRNVVVGEVWVCSGQSNMAVPVRSALQPEIEAAAADYPDIRHMRFGGLPQDFPIEDRAVSWSVCTPRSVLGFTAVGFFFGRRLFSELDVPIGLIHSSVGSSPIESWTPPVGFRSVPELTELNTLMDKWDVATEVGNKIFNDYISNMQKWLADAKRAVSKKENVSFAAVPPLPGRGKTKRTPTGLFNGMISPILPYAMRGVIWYQGGTNRGETDREYFLEMKALINGWRTLWQQGTFPFYFVQLSDFRQPNDSNPACGDGWAPTREGQRMSLGIPNTGMAVAIDVGGSEDHPKNKQDVGERLALWALARDYGRDISYSGPLYKSHTVEGDKVRISFDHCGSGLMFGDRTILPNLAIGLDPVREVKGGKTRWISIAGRDKKWQWADAVIDGNTLVVSSEEVAEPVAVRYAYTMRPVGVKLYNKEGLPASPFRTDTW